MKNHNFCSNPDRDPEGNWCYTEDVDVRYDHCNDDCSFKEIIKPEVIHFDSPEHCGKTENKIHIDEIQMDPYSGNSQKVGLISYFISKSMRKAVNVKHFVIQIIYIEEDVVVMTLYMETLWEVSRPIQRNSHGKFHSLVGLYVVVRSCPQRYCINTQGIC